MRCKTTTSDVGVGVDGAVETMRSAHRIDTLYHVPYPTSPAAEERSRPRRYVRYWNMHW